MSVTQPPYSLSALADKVALELAFAQPGSDLGLLPINSLIIEMEEVCRDDAMAEAIACGRAIVDGIFADAAQFTADSLAELNEWVTSLQEAVASTAPKKTREAAVDEKSLTLNLESDRDLLREFVNESREHLENIESGVLTLEDHPTDAETLNSIFRAFHTFKGGSGFLKLMPMNKLAHELESLLDLARTGKLQITPEIVEVILSGGDVLKQFVGLMDAQVSGAAPEGPIFVPTGPLRARIAKLIAAPSQLSPEAFESQTAFIQRAVTTIDPAHELASAAQQTIKVDTAKLDSLVDMVGELVIAQSLVTQDADLKGILNPRLARNLAQLSRVTKELQRSAMSLRMAPIRGTFRKMTRLVRDLAMRAGKEVNLILVGEETELDRTIVEELSDPLIHMMRNSVDHGIEGPDAREAAGKNLAGTITLAAFHEGGNFVLQIKDDGAGLNRERILKKAIAQGLVDSGAELSDKEVFNLIFLPGFSTAEAVTDVSGRGVGMDVVRKNIARLRGRVDVDSTAGQGTTISVRLPLTLAIIDALVVRVGEDRYILPALSVRESLRPTAGMVSKIYGRGEIVSVRGRLTPLLRLKQFFTAVPDTTPATEAVIVVLESDGIERCVLVDELIGKQEVVIKSLGGTFQDNPLLAGAAILGDGRVGLILDVKTLVQPPAVPMARAA